MCTGVRRGTGYNTGEKRDETRRAGEDDDEQNN